MHPTRNKGAIAEQQQQDALHDIDYRSDTAGNFTPTMHTSLLALGRHTAAKMFALAWVHTSKGPMAMPWCGHYVFSAPIVFPAAKTNFANQAILAGYGATIYADEI